MSTSEPISLELLAPARDKATAMAAIAHGADAIYIGAPSHGARAEAAVAITDIAEVATAAHRFRVRVYVALNTIIYDSELRDVERMIRELYTTGADAIIIQDMSIPAMDIPPIALHASTQTDIRDAERARELMEAGVTRIVPARELSIAETAEIGRELPDLEIEAFVHGALCVSYSGDCRASFAATGRSANRGECSQMCRHAYTLRDGAGNILMTDTYLLSLRDLNRSSRLGEMVSAGVTSFKIEGRLKDVSYVKETVGYYSRLLDRLVVDSGGRYRRASCGRRELGFIPDPARAFNRGFTQYFTSGTPPKGMQLKMASLDRPGYGGEEIGTVATVLPRGGVRLSLHSGVTLSAGDGLAYVNPSSGREEGFRVNRVSGNRDIYLPPGVATPPRGTILRRTFDREREQLLARADSGRRTIPLTIRLRQTPAGYLVAEAEDIMRGFVATVVGDEIHTDKASTAQGGRRRQPFEKLGGTIYTLETFVVDIDPDIFIPASTLTALRRRLIESVERTAAIRYRYPRPGRRNPGATLAGANISNHLAAKMSPDGAESAETRRPGGRGMEGERVMTTRYCIRRETGHCLATSAGGEWRDPLTISDSGGNCFRLDFDCRACRMHVIWEGKRRRER